MTTNDPEREAAKPSDGSMTTSEAGHKGGQRVRELIEEGKQQELRSGNANGFRERAGNPQPSQPNREAK